LKKTPSISKNNPTLNNNKKFTDISTTSRKLYDINEDLFNDNENNIGLTLNTLKKYKTFKEYKESLEKIASSNSNKKDLSLEDIKVNNKLSEISKDNLNLKIEKWDKKKSLSRKNLLQDLQNTRERFLIEKHKSYKIPSFSYPNIKRTSKSTTTPLSKPTVKNTISNNKNNNISNNNGLSYVESLKKEALSLAEKMKRIDENASEDIIKRFEKITNDSLEKSKTSPNNDHFNKLILKELRTKKNTKKESSKYDLLMTDTGLSNHSLLKSKSNLKSNDNKDIDTNQKEPKKDNENEKKDIEEDKVKDKDEDINKVKDKSSEENKNTNIKTEKTDTLLNLKDNKNKTVKTYNDEDMTSLVDNLMVNVSSPISYSKNIIEKSRQIKEKRRKEKKKGKKKTY